MIGILGGTFDPIHFGHLRPALEVVEALGLQQVRFIPLREAPHRDQPLASAEQRLAMVQAATANQAGFVADDRELLRQGKSYTYDTLRALRKDFGPVTPLCLLIGSDAFAGFPTWHRPAEILGLAHLVVMERPGRQRSRDPQLNRWIVERAATAVETLRKAPGGHIYFQPVTALDISATAIRGALAQDLSPRFLLPDAVLDLIGNEGLYRAPKANR